MKRWMALLLAALTLHGAAFAEAPATSKEDLRVTISINDRTFEATLAQTEAAEAFRALLPLTLDMRELHGNEKYAYTDEAFATDEAVPERINAGDLMLFGDSCVVLFYQSFTTSYAYTPLGSIENADGLENAIGAGNAAVTFTASSVE